MTKPHQIEKIVRDVSLTAIKHWLKISEREHSAQKPEHSMNVLPSLLMLRS
jgi:hypothetical protein